jgi:hypothetical protein
VTFLISEGGTLPNTADKRYPAFRLEALARERFDPLVSFLSYIAADFASTRMICKRAMADGLIVTATRAMLLALMSGLFAFWIFCGVRVLAGYRTLVDHFPAADTVMVYWANTTIFALAGSVAIVAALYAGLVVVSQFRQISTCRTARLKAVSGQFRREHWVGLVPASDAYEAMLESAPQAHHERARDAGQLRPA